MRGRSRIGPSLVNVVPIRIDVGNRWDHGRAPHQHIQRNKIVAWLIWVNLILKSSFLPRMKSQGTAGITGVLPVSIASVTKLWINACNRRNPSARVFNFGQPAKLLVCVESRASAAAAEWGSASTFVFVVWGGPRGVRPSASSLLSQKPCARNQNRRPALDQHMCGKHFHMFVMWT